MTQNQREKNNSPLPVNFAFSNVFHRRKFLNTAGQEKLFNSFFSELLLKSLKVFTSGIFSLKATPARQIRLVSIHYNISFISLLILFIISFETFEL
jgi:hypothetical protein